MGSFMSSDLDQTSNCRPAQFDEAWQGRRVWSWMGMTWQGRARLAGSGRRGTARLVELRRGTSRQERRVSVGCAGRGMARQGKPPLGRHGESCLAEPREACPVAAG